MMGSSDSFVPSIANRHAPGSMCRTSPSTFHGPSSTCWSCWSIDPNAPVSVKKW